MHLNTNRATIGYNPYKGMTSHDSSVVLFIVYRYNYSVLCDTHSQLNTVSKQTLHSQYSTIWKAPVFTRHMH